MKTLSRTVAAIALAASSAGPSWAATATTSFNVQIVITAECKIISAGNLDFGSFGVLDADHNTSSTISVQCTNSTTYNVGLDAGQNGGGDVTQRKMIGANPSTETVSYRLYKDPGRTTNWGNLTTTRLGGTGNGAAQALTVYGTVPVQTTPSPGTYTDVVAVTLTY